MKIPSRLMPPYIPNEPTLKDRAVGIIIMIGLLLLLALLIWNEPNSLWVFAAIGIFTFVASKHVDRKLWLLSIGREQDGICSFSRSFDPKQVDTWIIRAVYDELQPYLDYGKGICPLRARDDLMEDLHIDPDDIDMDILEVVAQRTGRSLDDIENNPYCGNVNTAADLVMFFNNQPKRSLKP